MKKIGVMIFVLIFLFAINYVYSQEPVKPKKSKEGEILGPGPIEPGSKEGEESPLLSPPPVSPPPGSPTSVKKPGAEAGEVFFTAGTTSPDGQYLYVIFDRFLLQYASQTLDLKKRVDLGIPVAPVTPSITVSKDSKKIYVICNGMLYQIDAATFKIENMKKITP